VTTTRRILAPQVVVRGLQDRGWVIVCEDLGLGELGDGEVGREETKQRRPEQHCVGWAVAERETTEGYEREDGVLRTG
jgi:hypothetical protein